jgi:hypothetical protein
MSEAQTRDYRYERKFLVDRLDVHQVRALVKLHPAMFYEPYPPRYVNNLYLDTEELDNYQENVSGTGERRKVRIRWYGDLFGLIEKPVLEFKIKSGLVGTKVTYPFAPFTFDKQFCHRLCRELLQKADLPVEAYARAARRPVQSLLSVVLCHARRAVPGDGRCGDGLLPGAKDEEPFCL